MVPAIRDRGGRRVGERESGRSWGRGVQRRKSKDEDAQSGPVSDLVGDGSTKVVVPERAIGDRLALEHDSVVLGGGLIRGGELVWEKYA